MEKLYLTQMEMLAGGINASCVATMISRGITLRASIQLSNLADQYATH